MTRNVVFPFCFLFVQLLLLKGILYIVCSVVVFSLLEGAKMNDGRQMGVNYVDAGFPYAVNENFVDFFQGFTPVPVNYAFAGSIPDQVFLSTCIFYFLFIFG